jgi:hypothetical protein
MFIETVLFLVFRIVATTTIQRTRNRFRDGGDSFLSGFIVKVMP